MDQKVEGNNNERRKIGNSFSKIGVIYLLSVSIVKSTLDQYFETLVP
tara:strand:- start:129 stop:269 length:141 start_codon:yes stop_codon:yes gene_type:complete